MSWKLYEWVANTPERQRPSSFVVCGNFCGSAFAELHTQAHVFRRQNFLSQCVGNVAVVTEMKCNRDDSLKSLQCHAQQNCTDLLSYHLCCFECNIHFHHLHFHTIFFSQHKKKYVVICFRESCYCWSTAKPNRCWLLLSMVLMVDKLCACVWDVWAITSVLYVVRLRASLLTKQIKPAIKSNAAAVNQKVALCVT